MNLRKLFIYLTLFISLVGNLFLGYKYKIEKDIISTEVCFTPDHKCTSLIIDEIAKTKKEILVQAYSFTSIAIAKALVRAKLDGVSVQVLLDRSNISSKYSCMKILQDNNIPVYIDSIKGIAHNKVMIFDSNRVLTGSFNFSKAADFKNVENLLIINDKALAKRYKKNWLARQKIGYFHPKTGI